MAGHFWLSDAQWVAIDPHIPKVYRGSGGLMTVG